MAGSHNKAHQARLRKNKPSSRAKDPESQTPLAAEQQQTDFALMIFGFHTFCAVSLYSTPYGVMMGGWAALVFLVIHFATSFVSAFQIVEIMSMYPDLRTFSDVGREAFDDHGGRVVGVFDFLLIWASCVESVMISHAAIVYASPNILKTFINQRSKIVIGVIWMIITALMGFICNMVDVEGPNTMLNGLGAIMNIVVVGCLLWLYLFNSFKQTKSTKKSIDFKHMPVANALFALCFAGHTALPRMYNRMRNRDDGRYLGLIIVSFIGSFLLYGFTAVIGYQLFGDSLKSIYVLNMPMELWASKIAIVTMVTHQCVRYIMGIHDMVTILTQGITEHRRAWIVFYTCLFVILTIPVTILAPSYSTVMSFVGSILGIVVSLVIPPACSIILMWQHMGTFEIVELMSMYPELWTYLHVGRHAFGDHGGRVVCVFDFLLIWASCVVSVMISYAAIVSGKSSTVAKLLSSVNISSGKIYTNSGKSTLAVGMNMTNSGNALEHFIPNNPPLNLILHLQIKFLE
ncbi:amino acid transporter AVT1C-like protein [Tanacetum coccineum]